MATFFFQAEDGIRDRDVTGVQTCALPIYPAGNAVGTPALTALPAGSTARTAPTSPTATSTTPTDNLALRGITVRSEERRVGKERRSRWIACHRKPTR